MSDLTPEEDRVLQEADLIRPAPQATKRKVSSSLLSPPTSSASSASSLSSTSIRYHGYDTKSAKQWFDFPTSIHSVAALEHIGFHAAAAQEIFANFKSRPEPDDNPDTLLDYAYGHISRPRLPDDARAMMTQVGLAAEFQDAILDTNFQEVYKTETLRYWIRDTLRIRYTTLVKLKEQLQARARYSLAKKEKKRPRVETIFGNAQPAAESSTVATAAYSGNPSSEEWSQHLPRSCVVVETAGPVLPGYTPLYKEKSEDDLRVGTQFISASGEINMEAIASANGGDFNADTRAWYFAPEEETAEAYRKYAETRCPTSETWMIRVLVPNTFIGSLRKQSIFYSKDWKEFVWYNRKQALKLPSKFKDMVNSQLIIGHTCKSWSIARIRQDEVQEKITEANVLNVSSGKAIQWAFLTGSVAERLGEEAKGHLHVDVFAPLNSRVDDSEN